MLENVYGKPIRGKQNMLYAKFVKAISFKFKNGKYNMVRLNLLLALAYLFLFTSCSLKPV